MTELQNRAFILPHGGGSPVALAKGMGVRRAITPTDFRFAPATSPSRGRDKSAFVKGAVG